jgi:pimeloyl-ACP methyl ester carboxylesterase
MNTLMPPYPSGMPAGQSGTPAWIVPDNKLRLLRVGMRLLGAVSPSYAATLMDRLWFAAPRRKPRAVEQAILDSGLRTTFMVHGRRVVSWTWGDGQPTIVLLHGWGGHAGQMSAFVAPLRQAGFRVITFDAPAHGASANSRHGGRRVTFFEFADALQAVTEGESNLAGIIAHSGGCTAVSLALRAGWKGPKNMVFVAPFAQPQHAVDDFARMISATSKVAEMFRRGVELWLGHPWSYLDITALEAQHKWRRLLVIHDEQDHDVPMEQSAALADSWPSASLVVTRDLGHRRILRDASVVNQAIAFFSGNSTAVAPENPTHQQNNARTELDAAYEAFLSYGSRSHDRH